MGEGVERSGRRQNFRHRARPRTRRSARSSCSDVSASMRPITRRMRSRRSATSLSVMICDLSRSPFSGPTSISGRSEVRPAGPTRPDNKDCRKASVEFVALNDDAGPRPPEIARDDHQHDIASRYFHDLPDRRPVRSNHRSRHFRDAAPSTLSRGGSPRAPWDRANPAPNAGLAAAPARAAARGAKPCAAAGCGVLPFSGSWPWIERNMLRHEFKEKSPFRACASRIPE